jgi:hypothetical protein
MTLFSKQSEFDFTVHSVENNQESQSILDEHKPKFSHQCKAIYYHFMNGGKLTSHSALQGIRYEGKLVQIGHLPRRIADLKENGVMLSFTLRDSFKEWYVSETDFEFNKTQFSYTEQIMDGQ